MDTRSYSPRCTLVQLRGRALRESGTVDPACYKPFEGITFGDLPVRGPLVLCCRVMLQPLCPMRWLLRLQVKGVHLCSSVAPKEADGFYARLCSVPIIHTDASAVSEGKASSAGPVVTALAGMAAGGSGAMVDPAVQAGEGGGGDDADFPPIAQLLRDTSELARSGMCTPQEKGDLKDVIVRSFGADGAVQPEHHATLRDAVKRIKQLSTRSLTGSPAAEAPKPNIAAQVVRFFCCPAVCLLSWPHVVMC